MKFLSILVQIFCILAGCVFLFIAYSSYNMAFQSSNTIMQQLAAFLQALIFIIPGFSLFILTVLIQINKNLVPKNNKGN